MLTGLCKIGPYEYFFYDNSLREPEFSFIEGEMCTNVNYAEIMGPDGILVYATIDSEGHVHRHGIYLPKGGSGEGTLSLQEHEGALVPFDR